MLFSYAQILTASSLKTGYSKYRQKMSDMGQGLLDVGCEDEFVEDSEIKNVWGTFFLSFTEFCVQRAYHSQTQS